MFFRLPGVALQHGWVFTNFGYSGLPGTPDSTLNTFDQLSDLQEATWDIYAALLLL